MTHNAINKIEALLEADEASMRQMNMALQAQGATPQQLATLKDTIPKLKVAGKTGLHLGALTGLGGALGGGLAGGVPGALMGGATLGLGGGLGGGIGSYINLNSMSKMTPQEIAKYGAAGEKKYGAEHAKLMRKAGSEF